MSQQDRTVTVSEKELNGYRSIYDTVLLFKKSAMEGAFGERFGLLSLKKIPQDNDTEQIRQWLSDFFGEAINTYVACADLRKNVYASSSESVNRKKNLEKIEKQVERLEKRKNKKIPTEDEYNKQLRQLEEKLQFCLDYNKELTDQTNESSISIKRNLRQIEGLEKLIKELKETGYIPNEEKKDENTQEETDAAEQAAEFSATIENEQEINSEIDDIKNKKKSAKKEEKRKIKEENEYLKYAKAKNVFGDTVAPSVENEQYDPYTGTYTHNTVLKSLTRDKEVIDTALYEASIAFNRILVLHNKDGQYFECHPATAPEIHLLHNNVISFYINGGKELPHDTEEELAIKQKFNYYHYSERLLDVMYINGGTLLYSPLEHYLSLSQAFGKRAAFIRRNMSEKMALYIFVSFLTLLTSKSTIAQWLNILSSDISYTRQYIIQFIIGMSRVFKGLAEYIRESSIKNTTTWHFDETKFLCLKISSGCYMWVAVTGKHELYPSALFFGAEGRANDEFLKIFGDIEEENVKVAIRNAVTDGHSAYPLGIKKLESYLKTLIRHAICLVHVRRLFLQAIEAFNLTTEYNVASKDLSTKNFVEKIEGLAKASGKNNLTDNAKKTLMASHILDLILALDSDFGITPAEEIKERRAKYSKDLMDNFFNIMDGILKNTNNIIKKSGTDGKISYEKTVNLPHLKAVVYALNHREGMYQFIEDGNIETHNNIAESVQRNCVRQRANMLFLYSKVGYQAYADALTIATTLKLNNINILKYLHWAFDNAKLLLEALRVTTPNSESARQWCYFPVAQRAEDGEKIGLYDARYTCAFDKIPWEKLDPWMYNMQFHAEMDIGMKLRKEKKQGGDNIEKTQQNSKKSTERTTAAEP